MIWIIIILVTLFIFSACALGNEHDDDLDAINEREYINHIKEEKEKRGKNAEFIEEVLCTI